MECLLSRDTYIALHVLVEREEGDHAIEDGRDDDERRKMIIILMHDGRVVRYVP